MRLISVAATLAACLLATGCSLSTYTRKAAECPPPPPPPPCAASAMTTRTIDTTTSLTPGAAQWRIERVRGASGTPHEFGLLWPGDSIGIVVGGSSRASAGYGVVELLHPNHVVTMVGGNAQLANQMLLTTIPSGNLTSDASVVSATIENNTVVLGGMLGEHINQPVTWDGHPAARGNIVVFASDREGSIGGTDLWYTTRDGSGRVRNLGSMVNTLCDEICPSFTPDGKAILFSSSGHAGAGGYDIFRANIRMVADTIVVTSVENIGLPMNTEFDEIFPVQYNETTLYYGSDQPVSNGGARKDFDVFVLHRHSNAQLRVSDVRNVPSPLPTLPRERATIVGVVINQQTQQPVNDAEVTAQDPETKVVVSSTRTDSSGRYSLDVPVDAPVTVTAQSSNLFFDGYRVTIPRLKAGQTVVREEPLALPITFVLRVNFPTSIFDNPYEYTLDSNGVETATTWSAAIDELAANVKQGITTLKKLVLIGHTDDVDTDPNNMRLGKQRVDFIMRQLSSRGVPTELMEGRSAGERLKLDRRPNEPIDTWRKRCRRVELVKVVQ